MAIASWDEVLRRLYSGYQDSNQAADLNNVMNWFQEQIDSTMTSEIAAERTAESFAYLDVAGYNYAHSQYVMDKELYPNRVIVGTESFPNRIDEIWSSVKENNHVIGDFTWTGWDYLGEAGVGRIEYDSDAVGQSPILYPWLTGWCGDIDIIGGLRKDPYIAVHQPQHYGKKAKSTSWSWCDSLSSWTWNGFEGKSVKVEVYADAEEVELLLNGRTTGKAEAGEAKRFIAMFETIYEPGELVAIAYSGGKESGRMMLRSGEGDVLLRVEADRTNIHASDSDLSFVMISLVDKNGTLYNTVDRKVTVEIDGPGILQGFGSANPAPEGNFFDTECTTFEGKALAVVRPTGVGDITVTVHMEGSKSQSVTIHACEAQ